MTVTLYHVEPAASRSPDRLLGMTPCSSCGADRGHLLGCEHSTISLAPTTAAPLADEPEVDTTKARAWGVPIALGIACVLGLATPGQFLLRVLFGMWLHELGHAVASWICGVFAAPLPWLTLGGEARSPFFIVLLFGGLGAFAYRSAAHRRWLLIPAGILVVGLLVPFRHVSTFITFFGDGGAMVFGALFLAGAMLLPDGARLSRGGLRWGYLVIGAGAFTDAFFTWVRSWRDVAELPFGRSDASGLSDASKLVDVAGWSETGLIRSYLGLGVLCLAVLGAVTVRQLTRRD